MTYRFWNTALTYSTTLLGTKFGEEKIYFKKINLYVVRHKMEVSHTMFYSHTYQYKE